MSKKTTIPFDPHGEAGEPKLEHWYGRIGISAVVAALRFTTTKEKSPINPTFTPKRRANLLLLSAIPGLADRKTPTWLSKKPPGGEPSS
jgi:hypothetical protein